MSDQAGGSRFNTLSIHAGRRLPWESAATLASADTSEDIGADAGSFTRRLLAAGEAEHPAGSRAVAMLEERIAALDGGSAAVATASGRLARLVACRVLMQPGDELVASRQLSRGGQAAFEQSVKSFGWLVKPADPDRPETFVEALSDKTKAILVESISAHGAVTDIEAIARVAQRARVPLVVDNSFATPVLVRPLEQGADVVIYSDPGLLCGTATGAGLIVDGGTFDWTDDARYPALAGPADDGSGLIIAEAFGNFAFAVACRALGRRDFGHAVLPTSASWMLLGVETLPLRVQRHCDNALAAARHLERHPSVSRVSYATSADNRDATIAQRCCPEGAGAALSFRLAGGHQAEARVLGRLRLLSTDKDIGEGPGENTGEGNGVGGTRSTAKAISDDRATAIQLWVGLEDKGDIIADLDQAMAG